MGQFLRYLLGGAAIIIIAVWIFTVLRSYQESTLTDKTINQSPTELTDQDKSAPEKDSDDPGDIDYSDAVKKGEDENSSEQEDEGSPDEMGADGGRRLTDATAGTDDSPYLVIAGTYTSEGNAKAEVNRLNKLGYDDAEVVQFIGSRYYTVCVDRLDRISAARQLRKKVKADNTEEVYVHRRRLPRKK